MRTPKRKNHLKQLIRLAANSEQKTKNIFAITQLIQEEAEENPFLSRSKLKQKVSERAMAELELTEMQTVQAYNAAANVLLPFMNTGEKVAQSDAQLDALGRIASENLFRTVRDKEGNAIDTEFDPKVMDSITRALKVKLDVLTKSQKNLIDAQKVMGDQQIEQEKLNLGIANRDELERFVNQELMQNPEFASILIQQKTETEQTLESSPFDDEVGPNLEIDLDE